MISRQKIFTKKTGHTVQVFIKFKIPPGPLTIRQVEELILDLQLLVKLAEKE